MIKHTIKLAIFDLDGTLIDSLGDIADAANMVLKESGMQPYPKEAYKNFIGNGLFILMKRIMPPDTADPRLHDYARSFKAIYSSNWNKRTKIYPGIEEMLQGLQQRSINLAVLSNKPDSFTKKCVKGFFPSTCFCRIYGQRDGVPPKPDPQGALEIASSLGILPEECMFVGDSAVDIETGLAAGMYTTGVSWGFRDTEELKNTGARLIITKPTELIEYVTRI